jgi:predicted MFS family arabinose efflux permease
MAATHAIVNTASMREEHDQSLSSRERWYVLLLLTGIYAVNSLDRNVLSVVVEPLKREFHLSDTAMGTLVGVAHSTSFALFVIPMGYLADRVNRVRLISGLVVLWSVLTSFGALATGYVSLLLMRVGVGAAEAGSPPASVALIADIFPRKVQPTALSIYYFAAAIGTGAMFLMGGYVAHRFGWRAVFLIAGVPGLLLGLLLLATVKEPRRLAAAEEPIAAGSWKTLTRSPALFWACFGGTVASVVQTSTTAWMTSFLIRDHGYTLINAALIAAASSGAGKGIGTLLSGPLTRRAANDEPSKLWRYPGITLVLTVPMAWYMVQTGSGITAAWMTIALGVMMGGWSGPAVAIMIVGVKRPSRGLATGFYQLATNLIGGLGALLTGALSDHLGGAIAIAMACTATLNIVSAFGLFLSCHYLAKREREGEFD